VVLLDFGIAKLSDALAPELTASHQSLGTPACMAPEQIHGLRADARSDVYALGGLLFHMLTGRIALQDESATMTQYLHLHARRPRASALAPVSSRVDDIIIRAMAIEPQDRFPDVHSFLAAARTALHQNAAVQATVEMEAAAILVTVTDGSDGTSFDERLFTDLEAVLPAAERALAGSGFTLAVDLGTSNLFVAPASSVADPVEVALATWDALERRANRDPRVGIGICVHRGPATFVGSAIQPCALLRPSSWRVPDPLVGVWVTGEIDRAAPHGRRVR
jgi:serine/threonine-protein kinase